MEGRRQHLPARRKAQVATYVAEVGQMTVGTLAERFRASIDTIRRDLDQLSAGGILRHTYGGAVSL
jgi:DeoR/GlpR family transcriptional regulator of sugar metabolism